MESERQNLLKKIFGYVGITLGVYILMKYLLPLVIPFLLGGGMAAALHPLVDKLAEKTHRRRSAIAVVIVFIAGVTAAVFFFWAGKTVLGQVVAFTRNRTVWRENMLAVWCGCTERFSRSTGWEIPEAEELFYQFEEKVLSGIQTRTLPYLVKNSVGYAKFLFSLLGMFLVAVISGLMMLIDYPRIVRYFHESEAGRCLIRMKRHAGKAGGTYLRAQLTILCLISVICVIGLFLVGNAYALLAGVGIGVCDALPFIGTGIIFIPWILIEVVYGHYWLAAAYGAIYLLSTLTRQFLEPRLIGEQLGCPPVLVLMSIYIGVKVYGWSGIILGPASAFCIYEFKEIVEG